MGLFRFLKRWLAPPPPLSGGAIDPAADTPSSLQGRDLTTPIEAASQNTVAASFPTTAPRVPTTADPPPQPAGSSTVSSATASFDGLKVDKFRPLSTSEALEQTDEANWQTAYWDPLNVIPAEDLPRIQVIDRTMVGMGLISAEQLAEIHAIGRQMEAFRTDRHAAHAAGERAVQDSRAERERIKQVKQAEAMERRRVRAEAIAERRRTDIVFLGRGVSRGLADRRSNIERLQQHGLPLLATPADLAKVLQISVPTLRWLAFHNEAPRTVHYVSFEVPKRSGGVRTISTPHTKLAAAQRWIFENVLAPLPTHDAAHGFVPGRSTLTGATPHVGAAVVVNVDLCEFFPTIDFARVCGLFRAKGYSPAVATILGLLCTEAPRRTLRYAGQTLHAATGPRCLPQGACTSPTLSNVIASRLDARLEGLAKAIGWRYTRYADDLTFSSAQADDKIGYLLARVRHLSAAEGFRVNEKKTRVLRSHTRQSVTGIVVNDRASIDRNTIRRLRAILHRASREGLDAQNRDEHPDFRAWLQGMIAYVEMVNAVQGKKLREALATLK